MKEIKFRAWDKTRNVSVDVTSLDLLHQRIQVNAGGMHSVSMPMSDFILMDVSGLDAPPDAEKKR